MNKKAAVWGNGLVIIILLLVIAIMIMFFIYLGKDKTPAPTTIVQQQTQQQQNNTVITLNNTPAPALYVSLELIPADACLGQPVTGVIKSTLPDATCSMYYKAGIMPTWFMYKNIRLDANGNYNESRAFDMTGTLQMYVSCRYDGEDIESNKDSATVSDCYYCTDSDNGNEPMTIGQCQDSYHMAGFEDNCLSANTLREYYCTSNSICESVDVTCGQCITGGICVE